MGDFGVSDLLATAFDPPLLHASRGIYSVFLAVIVAVHVEDCIWELERYLALFAYYL